MKKPVKRGGSPHFSITLPSFMVSDLDRLANTRQLSRSAMVKMLLVKAIEREAKLEELSEQVA